MASLQNLSVEIVQRIYFYILPVDIENFASLSRYIAQSAGKILDGHRKLIRKYGNIGY